MPKASATSRMVPLVPPLVAAGLAIALGHLFPLVSALLIALVLGAAITNSPLARASWMAGQAPIGKSMLRWGVVLLGLRLPLDSIAEIGIVGVAVILATVIATYSGTLALGRRLPIDDGLVTLIATGFSICGAAAIAAVEDAVRARKGDVGLAVALVTVFGSVMIVLIPMLARMLGLSPEQSAVWAGASIHEVAQVVAAASIIGPGALAIATTVKLGRVVLLAPVYAWTARRADAETHRSTRLVPWFVAGFAAMTVVRSLGIVPDGTLEVSNVATTFLLAAGMFGLGLGIRARDLWPVPLRVLALATGSTAIATGTSLALILLLW